MRDSKRIKPALALLLAAATLGVAATQAASAAGKEYSPRGQAVYTIVSKWGPHVQEAYKLNAGAWAREMQPLFADLPLATLQKAANATNFTVMNDTLLGAQSKSSISVTPEMLGQITSDLVYVPIVPCRIIDTRLAGGAITANTVRSFDVTAVADYSFQGGAASDCGGAGAAGSFAAAVINFVTVNPSGAGYITAFPFLATQPLAATLNYTVGSVVANSAIVSLDQGASPNELSVYTLAQTHLVADITGYFINPQATQLDCVEVTSAGVDIAAGGTGTQSTANCPIGYEITGGGCSSSTFDGKIVTSRTIENSPTSQSHFCAFRNQGAGTASFVAYGRCCRVPGR